MIKPREVHVQLTKSEAALMLMAYEAGVLALDNFNTLATSVMGMKVPEGVHKEMMERCIRLQEELVKQIYKKEKEVSKIIV